MSLSSPGPDIFIGFRISSSVKTENFFFKVPFKRVLPVIFFPAIVYTENDNFVEVGQRLLPQTDTEFPNREIPLLARSELGNPDCL